MNFFFVQDYRQNFRYFSSEPPSEIKLEFSRLRRLWESAKIKLLNLLPLKILLQEQAFGHTLKLEDNSISIFHSGRLDEKKNKRNFCFFLQRQRTKHIIVLIGESIILPISGLAAFLPGPNIFFYVLVLLVIIQWQALRGINKLLKKDHLFIPDQSLRKWETAVQNQNKTMFLPLLEKVEKIHSIQNLKKILWK
ncbi:hypothetical protein ACFLRW_04800 [Acidobacteriota bacterium]